jgi:nucleotide-binding universal stress UspA family protein
MLAITRTATEFLLLALVVWLAIGLTLALVMGRRGHSGFTWLVLGAVMGPLSFPLAKQAMSKESPAYAREVASGIAGVGVVDVLAGTDGSADSEAAVRTAVEMFGARIGRLTIASVADFGTFGERPPWLSEREAIASLERLVDQPSTPKPGAVVLSGRPADALVRYAQAEGYEILVVGRRGRGMSKAILGSTASQLARSAGVPVLIV